MTTRAATLVQRGFGKASGVLPGATRRGLGRWSPIVSLVLLLAALPPMIATAGGVGHRLAARFGAAVLVLAIAHVSVALVPRRAPASARRPASGSFDAGLVLLIAAWTAALLLLAPFDRHEDAIASAALLLAVAIGSIGLILASTPITGTASAVLPLVIVSLDAPRSALLAPAVLALAMSLLLLARRIRAADGAGAAVAAAFRGDAIEEDECLWSLGPDVRLRTLDGPPAILSPDRRTALHDLDWRGWVSHGARRRDEIGGRFRRLRRAVLKRERFRRIELPLSLDGEERWLSLTGWPVDGVRGGYRGVAIDRTDARSSETLLRRATEIDAVTGLANRSVLLHTLRGTLGERPGASSICLVLVDLDGFTAINDEHGSMLGDALLKAVAGRLLAGIRNGDLVARVGPDEFAVLCAGSGEQAAELARRLVGRLSEPFALDGSSVQVGGNAGVACMSEAADMTDLLKSAELALQAAAASNRSGGAVRVFEPAMREAARERHRLRVDLREALARNTLTLHYQPVVEIASGRIIACEALARWSHRERGPVAPSVFIPLAEQSGLIGRLGDWALQEACREAATWPGHARLTVNVSMIQLRNPGFGRSVDAALALSGLPAHRLELELTESVLLDDPETTVPMLQALRERGLTIALDDFGTAYASLSTLLAFRFDRVKLDRSFVTAIDHEPASLAITRSVLSLADGLGLSITAEGVERDEQRDLLLRLGCREAQGYLFSPPLPALAIRALLARAPHDDRHARRGAAD